MRHLVPTDINYLGDAEHHTTRRVVMEEDVTSLEILHQRPASIAAVRTAEISVVELSLERHLLIDLVETHSDNPPMFLASVQPELHRKLSTFLSKNILLHRFRKQKFGRGRENPEASISILPKNARGVCDVSTRRK